MIARVLFCYPQGVYLLSPCIRSNNESCSGCRGIRKGVEKKLIVIPQFAGYKSILFLKLNKFFSYRYLETKNASYQYSELIDILSQKTSIYK